MMKSINSFLRRREKHFGIDIGTGSVKIAEVDNGKGNAELKVLASAPVPLEAYRNGHIGDPESISAVIRELVNKTGVSTPFCVSAIEGQYVFNRFIKFPVMTKGEVLEAIKWDAENYIPYAPEDCYMDAVILGYEPDSKEMKVLVVAVGKDIIDNHVAVLKMAELAPVAIDFCALAQGRALLAAETKEASVILDIGASSTKMTIFKGQVITFSRTLPFGGNRLTRVLENQLGLSASEAEYYKIRQRDLLTAEDHDTAETANIRSMLMLAINDVKREINRSLEYYQMQNCEDAISSIIFTGGCALQPGLKELLTAELDVCPVVTDLSAIIDCSPAIDKKSLAAASPIFGTALGLALWEESR